jgi:S-adenosylmethionine:tRNA ribosyltransferase-isomerase
MLDILKTSTYSYNLPNELIASKPIIPADHSKLLIYNRKENSITHTIFKKIIEYIPKNTSIFINDTKVIKARIYGVKKTLGKIELLFIKNIENYKNLCLIKGKIEINSKIFFDNKLEAKIIKLNSDGTRIVEFYQNNKILNFQELIKILNQIGHIPLPPYINRKDNKNDEVDYQTIFCNKYGSVASPTASLHFTKELFQKIKDNFDINKITLHIGAGTFKNIETENILDHKIHSEYFEISNNSNEILRKSNKILAIGTTVTRTIEYNIRTKKQFGQCDLFLNPINKPQKVDYLLTNFHLPKSTLIMLVASFLGIEKTLEIYNIAIKKKYRFFSYGDSMLII